MNTRGKSIPLGRIFGIPIGLDISWFLIFALLVWTLSTNYYPVRFPGWGDSIYWVIGVSTTLLLFVSVLLHELGHAVAALAFRIPVRRIRLMIFGGVAELGDDAPNAGGEFLVAIAGPAVSVLLGVVFGAVWFVGRFTVGTIPIIAMMGYLAFLNLTLAVFNLIPGFPLDGGRVLRGVLWALTGSLSKATRIAGNIGRVIGFIFLGVGGVMMLLTGDFVNGIWLGFIGLFLQNAARSEMQVQRIRDMLTGRTVSQVMERNFSTIPGSVTVQQLMDAHLVGLSRRTFAVTENDDVVGLLSADNIRSISRDQWPFTPVSQIMKPLKDGEPIAPDTELWPALRQMELQNVGQLPVMADGQLMGLLRREDVVKFLNTLRLMGRQYA